MLTSQGGATDGDTGGTLMLNLGPCWAGGYNRYDPNCTEGYMPLVAQVDVTDPIPAAMFAV